MCILFWGFFVIFCVISKEMHDNWEGSFRGNKAKKKKILLSRRSIFSEIGLEIYAHHGAAMGP